MGNYGESQDRACFPPWFNHGQPWLKNGTMDFHCSLHVILIPCHIPLCAIYLWPPRELHLETPSEVIMQVEITACLLLFNSYLLSYKYKSAQYLCFVPHKCHLVCLKNNFLLFFSVYCIRKTPIHAKVSQPVISSWGSCLKDIPRHMEHQI